MERLRVGILRGDGPDDRYLEGVLCDNFEVPLVVVEPREVRLRRLAHQRKYRDLAYSRYNAWRSKITGYDRYCEQFFSSLPDRRGTPGSRLVGPVNDAALISQLSDAKPDVVVIASCSILSRRTLAAIDCPVVNLHSGVLPRYRGNHSTFFALYNGEPEFVGATLHHVTEDLDGGPVIEVLRQQVTGGKSVAQLYCRSVHEAAGRLVYWLTRFQQGQDLPRLPQDGRTARTYRNRDRGPLRDLKLALKRLRH